MLDAQAELYVARQPETRHEGPREASLEAPRTSAVANLAIEVRPDPKPAAPEHAPADSSAVPAATDAAASPDWRDAARSDERTDVTGAITGKAGTARFTTIYVHRGADPAAAYVVPRE